MHALSTGWHRALTVVALIPNQGLVYISWPPPTTVVKSFTVFHNNPLITVVLLALYVALRRVDASFMLIRTAAALLGATLMIVSREATLGMFSLSQQYTQPRGPRPGFATLTWLRQCDR